MRMLKIFLAAVTFLLLSGPLNAHANIIYNWTGDCQRVFQDAPPLCTHATMHFVTTDAYIPGEVFQYPGFPSESQHPTLLEVAYADDYVTKDLLFYWRVDGTSFQLPASSSDGGSFLTFALGFRSDASGNWEINGEELNTAPYCGELHNPFCGYRVQGIHGVWTRVPEPSTFVLLGVGLAGLASLRRRKVN
jgi:PEP-CTERM motif